MPSQYESNPVVEPAAAEAPNLKGMDRLQAVAPVVKSNACTLDLRSSAVTEHASDVDDTAIVVHCLHSSIQPSSHEL